jgi:hypothetical protein
MMNSTNCGRKFTMLPSGSVVHDGEVCGMQVYIYGLVLHRFTALPLLCLCYHFGTIYWVEFVAYAATDPVLAALTYWLQRRHMASVMQKNE